MMHGPFNVMVGQCRVKYTNWLLYNKVQAHDNTTIYQLLLHMLFTKFISDDTLKRCFALVVGFMRTFDLKLQKPPIAPRFRCDSHEYHPNNLS